MKIILFLLITILIPIVVLMVCILKTKPVKLQQDNMGNVLLDMFETKNKIIFYESKNKTINEYYQLVLKNLRTEEPKNNQRFNLYRNLLKMVTYNPTDTSKWIFDKNKIIEYWDKNGKDFREALLKSSKEMFPDFNVEREVVVHLRFGDVPFNELHLKKSIYHMQYYSYYIWALERLKARNILLVYSTHWTGKEKEEHNQNMKDVMENYVDDWVTYIQDYGYNVVKQSSDALTDFLTLLNAHKIIASTSTYAFCASIGRNENEVCMPMLGSESIGIYTISKNIPPYMYTIKPLQHSKIRKMNLNYTNIKEIKNILREKIL